MTKNTSTVVSEELQQELAEYGIFRKEAVKNTSASNPMFGFRDTYNGYEAKYHASAASIQDAQMQIAVVAPENMPFDMLVTTNFKEAVRTARPDDLRAYLRSIVDKV